MWQMMMNPSASVLAMEQAHQAAWAANPLLDQSVTGQYMGGMDAQHAIWDGGVSPDCYAAAAAALGTYGAGVAACASAETGIGAIACAAAFPAVGAASYSAVSACYGANASANNGNGSAGPGY